jgi:hypothetical protein
MICAAEPGQLDNQRNSIGLPVPPCRGGTGYWPTAGLPCRAGTGRGVVPDRACLGMASTSEAGGSPVVLPRLVKRLPPQAASKRAITNGG